MVALPVYRVQQLETCNTGSRTGGAGSATAARVTGSATPRVRGPPAFGGVFRVSYVPATGNEDI